MPEQQPWQLAGFDERIEATGWPEWEVPFLNLISEKCRLYFRWQPKRRIFRVQTYNDGRWREVHSITDHEAACLIAARFDEVLDKHRAFVRQSWDGRTWDAYCRNPEEVSRWKLIGRLPSRHEAQAAAVDAVLKEKDDAK